MIPHLSLILNSIILYPDKKYNLLLSDTHCELVFGQYFSYILLLIVFSSFVYNILIKVFIWNSKTNYSGRRELL